MQSKSAALYEARIAELKEAHANHLREKDRVIDVLAEQVEYLRASGGMPQPIRAGVPMRPLTAVSVPGPQLATNDLVMSEEEEDLRGMYSNNLIDVEDLKAALADLGIEDA